MQRALLLNVVVRERTTIFELFASEDETLLVWRDTLLILDLCLYVVNSVRGLYFQRDRLPGQGLHENLHATTQTEDKVKSGFFLDVIVRKRATILKLLAGENQTLLIRRDALFILDFRLDIVNSIGGLDFKRNRLPGESLDEDLHATAETKDEMERRLLLDVIVGESPPVFELLPGENEPLLVRGDAFLVLNLRLDVVDSVGGFNFECDCLARQGLNEDLHTTTETKHYEEWCENKFKSRNYRRRDIPR